MDLPQVIANLITAQNKFDSVAYSNCFCETGIMLDEGRVHIGRAKISQWIIEGNKKYNPVMRPISFEGDENKGVLKIEISGTFPGSPLIFTYDLEFVEGLIQSLTITV
ncbi:nuclear transport factor 2 family protein [Sphingobacterium prati]|uniref:nuclear transport factor 2 family protein n=1 Tax=Sphingobacterium prati TaxID=2737006 RepID=UPI0015551354|nr:nuclear transport factor 2 family protein [Sphingobacterium prati]NPE48208.1 nuclear transport factor 2 family protein [Sphingobacterium prati]